MLKYTAMQARTKGGLGRREILHFARGFGCFWCFFEICYPPKSEPPPLSEIPGYAAASMSPLMA